MTETFTTVDWAMCGTVCLLILASIYAHVEGNRVTATRFVYHDIRREMGHLPRRTVWWRAFCIAMGWRKRPGASRRNNVTPINSFTR